MKNKSNAAEAAGTMYLVSTSHMDWDWVNTFEGYYTNGQPNGLSGSDVKNILTQAMEGIASQAAYQYNLAEVAWLIRYFQDFPEKLSIFQSYTSQNPRPFVFLGGGITSPDNLVCNGEAFIRNYLVGRKFIKDNGLEPLLTDVCWIPDDFGQDPQLPVVLAAMGMKGVSFQRLPGNQPKSKGVDSTVNFLPAETLSQKVHREGVCFWWKAADQSQIFTKQMAYSYGVIWGQSIGQVWHGDNPAQLQALIDFQAKRPGNLYMAPCGGDFSIPSTRLLETMEQFNGTHTNGVQAKMGSFQDYIDAVMEFVKNNSNDPANPPLQTYDYFDASLYWTGYFASRPQLKIDQQRGVNKLLSSEVLTAFLYAQNNSPTTQLAQLNTIIEQGWQELVPSSHHDFVTGTSPDWVYQQEQLPRSKKALEYAENSNTTAMTLLGNKVATAPLPGETPYVIFNSLGRYSPRNGLVKVADANAETPFLSFRRSGETSRMAVQRLKEEPGKCIFPVLGMGCLTYTVYYLSIEAAEVNPLVPLSEATMGNGFISIQTSSGSGYALEKITSVEEGKELLGEGEMANVIRLYSETKSPASPATFPNFEGNIYQMGNELYPQSTYGDGFFYDPDSGFVGLEGGGVIESGPYLWHYKGQISHPTRGLTLDIEYFLEYGSSVVRVRITGQAAAMAANSIVSTWNISNKNQASSLKMNYGTANHWNGGELTPYWNGPTFRSTHDFLTVHKEDNAAGTPLAAIYHEGMRAWALHEGDLLGILFRNAPGQERGAHGTDTDVHVQNFAIDLLNPTAPGTCGPLAASLIFQRDLLVEKVTTNPEITADLPELGSLMTMESDGALIQVVRSPLEDPRSLIVRIYQPSNDTNRSWTLTPTFLIGKSAPTFSLVTALEEPLTDSDTRLEYDPGVNKLTIYNMPTLTTIKIQLAEE